MGGIVKKMSNQDFREATQVARQSRRVKSALLIIRGFLVSARALMLRVVRCT